jgi:hypothetical protein
MKTALQIFRYNDSLCIDVTAFAQELGWQEGAAVEVIKSTSGIELISTRSLNAQAMGTAKDFMEKYPAAMKRLAE